MTVFKLCLRIIKQNIPAIVIFIGLFLGISLIVTNSGAERERAAFSQAKVNLAFFSDESTPLTQGLEAELQKIANFVSMPDDDEVLLDALFFGEISYILRITPGFTEAFYAGKDPKLETIPGPNESRGVYVDLAINNYLNTLRVYHALLPGQSESAQIANVRSDLAVQSSVSMAYQQENPNDFIEARIYFNYLAYSLFAILILGISTNLMVFNNKKIRMRQACSPLKSQVLNIQLFIANFVYALVCWGIMNIFCLIFIPNLLGTSQLYLFLLNSFALTFWASCISFLIAHLVKTRNAVSAVTNIVVLGSSFLAGVFVPQEILGEGVLKVASFTPTYWYVLANTQITQVREKAISSITALAGQTGLLSSIALQLGFGIVFLAIALVIGKRQRTYAG